MLLTLGLCVTIVLAAVTAVLFVVRGVDPERRYLGAAGFSLALVSLLTFFVYVRTYLQPH